MALRIICAALLSLASACNGKTAAGTCNSNHDCDAGSICSSGRCRALCRSDTDCAAGEICRVSLCEPGARAAAPTIAAIDGDGSADAGPPDSRGERTAHHLRRLIRVTGTALEGASVSLVPQPGSPVPLTVLASTDAQLDAELPAELVPAGLGPGLHLLVIANAVGSAQAQVWLLQGEPGEAGPAGSPDTGIQIQAKLGGLPAAGTQVDADTVDGLDSAAFLPAAEPTGGRNLFVNPDLANGERGWEPAWAYANYTFTRTLASDASAPVQSRRKLVFTVTALGPTGDAAIGALRVSNLKLDTDYNISCFVRTTGPAIGTFNVERHLPDWSDRSDVDIPWVYASDGAWHRVSGTFNTGDHPMVVTHLRSFTDFGTWEVTGCQLTEGARLRTFSVDAVDLGCPDDSVQRLGFCIYHVGGYDKTFLQAATACRDLGMRLCSRAEVSAAQVLGGQWCSWGWVADRVDNATAYVAYPMQPPGSAGCCLGGGVCESPVAMTATYGANCCR